MQIEHLFAVHEATLGERLDRRKPLLEQNNLPGICVDPSFEPLDLFFDLFDLQGDKFLPVISAHRRVQSLC